jgi:hypothetical protein
VRLVEPPPTPALRPPKSCPSILGPAEAMTVHVPKCHSTCGLNAAQYYFLLFLNFERISRIDGFANKPPMLS